MKTVKVALAMTLGIGILGHGSFAAPPETPKQMRVGVIGAGSLGGTVGSVLVKAGHEVKFSSRHPEELVAMTREPVIVGNLAAGKKFERDGPGFRANTTAEKLRRLLGLPEG